MSDVSVLTGDSDWPAAWPLDVAAATIAAPAPVAQGSPSVRYVYASIRQHGKITTGEIAQRTGLPSRTVRYAVRWLADHGILSRVAVLGDARKNRVIPFPFHPAPTPNVC